MNHWKELDDKLERLDEATKIVNDFFEDNAPDSFTDYMECYEVLGKLKEILVDTKR